jgi:hypothetical protein
VTSTFTHTTAAGVCTITGLPFSSRTTDSLLYRGTVAWQGITKANYTHVHPYVGANDTTIRMQASGSAVNIADVDAADMPTTGTVILRGMISYWAPEA